MQPSRSPMRILAWIICSFLTLSVLQPGTVTTAAAPVLPQPQAQTIPPTADEMPQTVPLSTETAEKTWNILLIGCDGTSTRERTRSDAMILCTLSGDTLVLTSFLRDLYVKIPGHGKNRINAAYAFGGADLLMQTLEENFGVSCDGAVEVDFSRFPEIIDLLGGVTIELRADEARIINRDTGSSLTEGAQLLNGQQALAYSRIRKLDTDGDFSRTQRQRTLLTALLEQYRNTSLLKVLSLLDDILPLLSTQMETATLLDFASSGFRALPRLQVHSRHIPEAGTYRCERIDGMDVLVADMDKTRELLASDIP